jgi:hypothetical protein
LITKLVKKQRTERFNLKCSINKLFCMVSIQDRNSPYIKLYLVSKIKTPPHYILLDFLIFKEWFQQKKTKNVLIAAKIVTE